MPSQKPDTSSVQLRLRSGQLFGKQNFRHPQQKIHRLDHQNRSEIFRRRSLPGQGVDRGRVGPRRKRNPQDAQHDTSVRPGEKDPLFVAGENDAGKVPSQSDRLQEKTIRVRGENR